MVNVLWNILQNDLLSRMNYPHLQLMIASDLRASDPLTSWVTPPLTGTHHQVPGTIGVLSHADAIVLKMVQF